MYKIVEFSFLLQIDLDQKYQGDGAWKDVYS